MFELLKKKINEIKLEKSQDIIKNIHKSFDEAGAILIKEANTILNNSYYEQLDKKKKLLTSCGFTNTKISQEIKVLETTVKKGEEIKKYADIFNNFYKVISIEQVKEISKKYKLAMGRTSEYKEEVPEINLKEISNFLSACGRKGEFGSSIESNLLICAPKKEFNSNTELYINNGELLELKDPIVLFPCETKLIIDTDYNYNKVMKNKYFYVITKWGIEASDELVVNQKMN